VLSIDSKIDDLVRSNFGGISRDFVTNEAHRPVMSATEL